MAGAVRSVADVDVRALRRVQRTVHLAAGMILAVYVYSPWSTDPAFRDVTRFGVLPLLIVTGLGIWLAPRWLARRRRATRGRPPA